MGSRKEVTQYLTWGLLLIAGAVVLFIAKFVTSFPLVPQIIGALIFIFGLLNIKKKGFLGFILIVVGAMIFFGFFFNIAKLLSVLGWIMFIVGGVLIAMGIFKVKNQ